MPTHSSSSSSPARAIRGARPVAAGLLLSVLMAVPGCSVAPPNGTPIIRAVPPAPAASAADPAAPMVVGREGVIVLFKPGDRIDLDFDMRGSIAHVEGAREQRVLVVDREFMVWTRGGDRASISFDDGRTWRPASKAIEGSFDIDWRRTSPEQGGDVSELIVGITASPR